MGCVRGAETSVQRNKVMARVWRPPPPSPGRVRSPPSRLAGPCPMKKGPTHAERVVIDTDKRRLKTGSAKRPVRHTRVGRSQPRQLHPPWRVVHVVSRTDGCVPPTPPVSPPPTAIDRTGPYPGPINHPIDTTTQQTQSPRTHRTHVCGTDGGTPAAWLWVDVGPPLGLGPLCASDLKSDALPRHRRFLHRTPGVLPGLDIGGGDERTAQGSQNKEPAPPPPFPARNGCHHRPASCVTPAVRAVLIPAVIPSVIAPTGHTHTRRGKADGPRHPSTQRARARRIPSALRQAHATQTRGTVGTQDGLWE